MVDPADAKATPEEPATPSASASGRTDGFLAPDFGDDRRGRAQTARSPYDRGDDTYDDATDRSSRAGWDRGTPIPVRRPFSLDTRPDWMLAVRREDARNVRYGRPVSVVILELASDATGPDLDVVAGDVADVIRDQSRSTDRAVRLSAASFRILMPETGAESARVAADRLERTYESTSSGERGEALHVAVVSSSWARSLGDALADAEEGLRLADRPPSSPSN